LNRKRAECRTHSFTPLSKAIIAECAARNVGTIAVGDLTGIQEYADRDD